MLRLVAVTPPSRRQGLPGAIANYLVTSHPNPLRGRLVTAALAACRKTQRRRPSTSQPLELTRCIVVKPRVSETERGVLFVSFETELAKLMEQPDFETLERDYQIAFLPTWQPCYSGALFALAARARLPYVIMPAGTDVDSIAREHGPLCIAAPLQASSWASASAFQSDPDKNIDLLMLANFSKYKRHWRLFQGVAQIAKPLRIVIAGRPWLGRTAETLRAEARAFGVADRISIKPDPSNAEVSEMLARSRLLCAMSHKEGSFIAVAEALLSGTPVAMYADAMIGSKAFINPETGFLLDPRRPLGPQLENALAAAHSLQPRSWAAANIAAEASMPRLNALLAADSARRGTPWTRDAAPVHCRNFAFSYLDPADAGQFECEYRHLADRHGLSFAEFPVGATSLRTPAA